MSEHGPDAIIAGAGTAGMAAAIAAAEGGARVVVVEQSDDVGGTLHVASGQLSAAGTRRQRELGVEDDPERHFEEVMRIGGGLADPEIVRLAVEQAPRTIAWLEQLGLVFDEQTPTVYHGHEPYAVPRTCWGLDGARSILAVLRVPFERAIADGRIELLLAHEVVALLEEAGAVVGVRVRDAGDERELRAPVTLLTTGGHAAAPDRFGPLTEGRPSISASRPTSVGSGIDAALRVGAAFRGAEHHLPTVGGYETAPGAGTSGTRLDGAGPFATLNPNAQPPREIHVDVHGRRFCAEDDRSPDRRERAFQRLPEQRCWVVFDSAVLADGPLFDPAWSVADLEQRVAEGRLAWSAPDVAALARRAGVDADRLVATVAAFNAAVADGHDPLGRLDLRHPLTEPPFYAVLVSAVVVVTFGGVRVDGELRVCNAEGGAIPGLLAAGEAIGAAATMGNAYVGGMCVTPALSLGRLLGDAVAAHAGTLATGATR